MMRTIISLPAARLILLPDDNLVYSYLVQCYLTSGAPEESNTPPDSFTV